MLSQSPWTVRSNCFFWLSMIESRYSFQLCFPIRITSKTATTNRSTVIFGIWFFWKFFSCFFSSWFLVCASRWFFSLCFFSLIFSFHSSSLSPIFVFLLSRISYSFVLLFSHFLFSRFLSSRFYFPVFSLTLIFYCIWVHTLPITSSFLSVKSIPVCTMHKLEHKIFCVGPFTPSYIDSLLC